MSVTSNAFGRVVLTGDDAKRFHEQIRTQEKSKSAVETVKRGVALARQLGENGRVVVRIAK